MNKTNTNHIYALACLAGHINAIKLRVRTEKAANDIAREQYRERNGFREYQEVVLSQGYLNTAEKELVAAQRDLERLLARA